MTYEQAREYIDSLKLRGIVPGLMTVSRLLSELGDPENSLNIIHIAGTNGKGSVGAFLESVILHSGKSVCRFATPAVGDYLEMFTYNGTPVSRAEYTGAAERTVAAIESLEGEGIFPTSFEAETAIAFFIFSQLAPDFAIIECGMGGELDATNVIKSPAAAVLSSISLDHKAYLGDTISEIAKNKAGIIKDGSSVITVRQLLEAVDVIKQTAESKNARLYIADNIENIVYYPDKTEFEFEGIKYTINMLGAFQPQNAALAVKTAKVLGIDAASTKSGLAAAEWQYRFERAGRFILDGAHNEDAAKMLAQSLEIYTRPESTAFICGCFRDKDYEKIARITAPYAAAVYCVTPPTERGLASETLCYAFRRAGAEAYDAGSLSSAIAAVTEANYKNIVIFGSLSILREAGELITESGGQHA